MDNVLNVDDQDGICGQGDRFVVSNVVGNVEKIVDGWWFGGGLWWWGCVGLWRWCGVLCVMLQVVFVVCENCFFILGVQLDVVGLVECI